MTTLVGIRAGQVKEGVVLASDLSQTKTVWSPQGDVAYRQQTKLEGQKIYVDDSRQLAVCMSGIYDQPYIDFLSGILKGQIDFQKAVEKEFFPELANLTLSRWGGKVPENELYNGLLVATRFDNRPKLYTCFPLGKVEERNWTSIGSGSQFALEHISKQGKLIPHYLGLEEAVDLAQSSLDKASQDLYTGGLDIVVIAPGEITEFGSEIKAEIERARTRSIERLKRKIA
ncbi:MAG: hypothetical protein PHF67_00115 [Candidatus Nanoarchaeia archaeon]|nr:hypothetical protein [Candidatus Nanoarchaeia archaeon]